MKLLESRPIPLGSFASVMGIAALGLAWDAAVRGQGVPPDIGAWIIAASALLFVVLLVAWLARVASNPAELRAEANGAITSSYFGTLTISVSLLAVGALQYSRPVAFALWLVGAFGGAALLIYLLGRWIEHGIKDVELTPALFIPVVGNATSVYAAVPLGFSEIGWASFSFALLCWLTLGPIIMYRLLVIEPKMTRRTAPQLAVLVSSPAVMASAWYVLDGGVTDAAFKILAFKALFFAILVVRLWKSAWGEPYNVGMWGWTFPAAALAGAFERAASADSTPLYNALATITLAAATFTVAFCVIATIVGWARLLRSTAVPA